MPKSRHRRRSFRLWRSGQPGLRMAQEVVDGLLEKNRENNELLPFIVDLKLKISREVRDNAAFELKERREALELSDLEAAHRNGTSLMLQVKAQIEQQLQRLVSLGELVEALSPGGRVPAGAPTGPAQDPPTADKAPDVLPESTGSSEMNDPGTDVETMAGGTGASEGTPEEVPSSVIETSGPEESTTGGSLGGQCWVETELPGSDQLARSNDPAHPPARGTDG